MRKSELKAIIRECLNESGDRINIPLDKRYQPDREEYVKSIQSTARARKLGKKTNYAGQNGALAYDHAMKTKKLKRKLRTEAMTDQEKKEGLRRNLQRGTPKSFGRTLRRIVAQNKGKTAEDNKEFDILKTVKKTQDKGRSATRGKSSSFVGKRPRGY